MKQKRTSWQWAGIMSLCLFFGILFGCSRNQDSPDPIPVVCDITVTTTAQSVANEDSTFTERVQVQLVEICSDESSSHKEYGVKVENGTKNQAFENVVGNTSLAELSFTYDIPKTQVAPGDSYIVRGYAKLDDGTYTYSEALTRTRPTEDQGEGGGGDIPNPTQVSLAVETTDSTATLTVTVSDNPADISEVITFYDTDSLILATPPFPDIDSIYCEVTSPGVFGARVLNLVPSTTYYFRTRTTDSNNNVTFSEIAKQVTQAPANPTVVTLTVEVTSTLGILEGSVTQNPCEIDSLVIFYDTNADNVTEAQIVAGVPQKIVCDNVGLYGSYAANLTNLTPSTQYHFRTQVTDKCGTVTYSDVVSATTNAPTNATIIDLDVDATSTSSITIAGFITYNACAISSVETYYATTYQGVPTDSIDAGTPSRINCTYTVATGSFAATVNNLQQATTYYFRTKTTDSCGQITYSSIEEATTNTEAGGGGSVNTTLVDITVTPDYGGASFQVEITSNPCEIRSVTMFYSENRNDLSTAYINARIPTSISCTKDANGFYVGTAMDLLDDTMCYFRAQVVDSCGNVTYSEIAEVSPTPL